MADWQLLMTSRENNQFYFLKILFCEGVVTYDVSPHCFRVDGERSCVRTRDSSPFMVLLSAECQTGSNNPHSFKNTNMAVSFKGTTDSVQSSPLNKKTTHTKKQKKRAVLSIK